MAGSIGRRSYWRKRDARVFQSVNQWRLQYHRTDTSSLFKITSAGEKRYISFGKQVFALTNITSCLLQVNCFVCSPFFVHDKLAVSWRRAAFGLIFDDDLVSSIRQKLLDFAQKLDNIVSLAFTNIEKQKESLRRPTPYYLKQAERALWNNVSEWNRFQHIADLLNPTVCESFKTMSKDVTSVSKSSPVLASLATGLEVLYTAAYLVLCQMDNGMTKPAAMLARSCIIEAFNPVLFTTHHEKGCDSDKELAWPSAQELFSTVVQCHDKIAESFWGGSCKNGLIYVMNVLVSAIDNTSWAWSVRYTWNVAPWINKSLATGLMGKEMDSTVNIVSLIGPSAMILGLLCIVLPIDVGNISSIEQVR